MHILPAVRSLRNSPPWGGELRKRVIAGSISTTILQGDVFGAFFVLWLLFMAVYIGMIVWTYSDAQHNSSQSEVLWALVVFFAPFLGIVLYFLLGRDRA